MKNLLCSFDTTRFYNDGNEDCVYVYSARDSNNTPDKTLKFTAVEYGLPSNKDVDIELTGAWENTKYSKQLKVKSFKEVMPTTHDVIIAYL